MQAWFPATSSVPSAVSTPHRLVEAQSSGAIWAFLWSDCVLLSMLPSSSSGGSYFSSHSSNSSNNDSNNNSSNNNSSNNNNNNSSSKGGQSRYSGSRSGLDALSLRPIAVCAFHLLLAELLHSQQPLLASGYLQQGLALCLPGFPASLEFLLHYALNCGDAPFLSAALQLLSQLPFFSHILVRCLRKQERSMWPFAVQNAEDIKSLYLHFLFNNDMEYAVTTISILQGLLCSVGSAWTAEAQPPLRLETWRQALQGSEEWLLDDYSEVFCCSVAEECVAHLSGLQLLFVAIIRGEYALLADIYRFLLMEVGFGAACEVGSAARRGGEAHPRGVSGVARAERGGGAAAAARPHGLAGAAAEERGVRVGRVDAPRDRELRGELGGAAARQRVADGGARRGAGERPDERRAGERGGLGVGLRAACEVGFCCGGA